MLDGDIAGSEEEERAEQFPGEIKQQKWVGWVCKEQAELLRATLRCHRRWFDGGSSPEMSKATGKQRRKKARTTVAQVIKDGQEAQGSHDGAISLASAMPRWPRARLEASRRIIGNVARAVNTVHENYRIAIQFKNPNYSQNCITTQKSPKTKVVQNQIFYNFAFITNP